MDEKRRALVMSIAAKTLSARGDPFLFNLQPFPFKRRAPPLSFNSKIRDGISFESITSVFDERDFVGAFRMSPTAFQKLFRIVRRVWIKSKSAGIRSKRQTISVDIRLAITLRLLAGAKKWDIIGFFG